MTKKKNHSLKKEEIFNEKHKKQISKKTDLGNQINLLTELSKISYISILIITYMLLSEFLYKYT